MARLENGDAIDLSRSERWRPDTNALTMARTGLGWDRPPATARYVTRAPDPARSDSTTPEPESQEPRFRLYALCPCPRCDNTGRYLDEKCPECRGEGKVRTLIAEADDEAGVGVALVTCAREGAWDGCQLGLLDTLGETGLKWLVRPWAASPTARNASDAARVLQARKRGN